MKITKIKVMGLAKLNNAEYKNFMERFYNYIPRMGVDSDNRPGELSVLQQEEETTSDFVGISEEDKRAFNADMVLLTDAINRSRTNDNTALLAEIDKQRAPLISFIINTATIGRRSSNPTYAQASTSLYNILKPYRGIQRIPMQQEAAKIKGMLYDLDKAENKPKVTLLHLDETVKELREVNDEFDMIVNDRTNELAANMLGATKEIRQRIDKQYDEISTTIFAYSIASPSEEATMFVTQLNKLIDETTNAYNVRRGIAEANKKKGEQDTDKPIEENPNTDKPSTDKPSDTTKPDEEKPGGTGGNDYEDRPGEL